MQASHLSANIATLGLHHEWNVNCSKFARSLILRTGMIGYDIDCFLKLSTIGPYVIVVRFPNFIAYAHAAQIQAGNIRAKSTKETRKTDPLLSVGMSRDGSVFVSDYDLQCIYLGESGRWRKMDTRGYVFGSAANPDVDQTIVRLNKLLKIPIQHGANDDFIAENKEKAIQNYRDTDGWSAFIFGDCEIIESKNELKAFYRSHDLHWPIEYD